MYESRKGDAVNKYIGASLTRLGGLALAAMPMFASGITSEASAAPVNLVCDVEMGFPINGFGQPTSKSRSRIRVVLDIDKKTGAYSGHFGIRSDRPGQLEVTDDLYVVTWSGSLDIQGSVVLEERLALDRFTGKLLQALMLGDGRTFGLVEGTCTKSEGPIF